MDDEDEEGDAVAQELAEHEEDGEGGGEGEEIDMSFLDQIAKGEANFAVSFNTVVFFFLLFSTISHSRPSIFTTNDRKKNVKYDVGIFHAINSTLRVAFVSGFVSRSLAAVPV